MLLHFFSPICADDITNESEEATDKIIITINGYDIDLLSETINVEETIFDEIILQTLKESNEKQKESLSYAMDYDHHRHHRGNRRVRHSHIRHNRERVVALSRHRSADLRSDRSVDVPILL